jgi:uncharacterized protein (DUF2141 family)
MPKATAVLGYGAAMFVLACFLRVAPATAAELDVQISKLRSAQGKVIVCLFKEAQDFPACDKQVPFRRLELSASTQPLTAIFRDIPDGSYAVAAAHNETGKLELNFLGIPKFGVGLKTGGWSLLGPGSFAKNSIDLRGRAQVDVEMRYF